MTALTGIGGERYWVHIPATKPRAYKSGGLVAAAKAVKGSPMANEFGDSELVHVNKYEMEKLREMWGDPGINPETGLPAYGLFGKILKGVAKIAGTVLLTPVLGPVGAAAAVSAVTGIVEGDSIEDILTNTALTAATAGAGQIGSKVIPGLTGLSEEAGRAIGAGFGSFGGSLATGQSFEDSLTRGVTAGLGTYASNQLFDKVVGNNILGLGDAANWLYGVGEDLSNAIGVDLGGATADWFVPGSTNVDTSGNITVTAGQQGAANTNLTTTGGTTTGGTRTDTGAGTDTKAADTKADQTGDNKALEDKDTLLITGNQATNTNLTTGGANTGANTNTAADTKADDTKADEDKDNTITVTGDKATNTNLTTNTNTNTNTNNNADNKADDKSDDKKDDTITVTGDKATNTNLTTNTNTNTNNNTNNTNNNTNNPATGTNIYNIGTTTTAADNTTPLTPRGGTYSTDVNRPDIFGTRGVAGIGFDPFTYGQAIQGGQPGEFLFFTQNGRPYGQVGAYTGPLANRPTTVASAQRAAGVTPAAVPDSTRLTVRDTNTTPRPNTQTNQGVRATPENTGMTQERLDQLQDRYENMRSGEFFTYFKAVNDALNNYTSKGIMTPEQAKAYQARLETAASKPDASLASLKAAVPMPQISDYLKPTGSRAESEQGKAAAANIPAQTQALTAAPKTGMTAGEYYNKYVAPLAGSYFNSGKLNAEQARGLTNAAFNFVKSDDLAGAQNAVNTYLTNAGLAAPAMAEGGDVDGDDMAAHLMAYHKHGGHTGPGQVKGIGSGQEDKIPAWLSDGEYVWSAQDVADLGDGSTDEGVRRLDKMRQMVRRRAGRKDVKNIAKPQRGIDTMLKAVGGAV